MIVKPISESNWVDTHTCITNSSYLEFSRLGLCRKQPNSAYKGNVTGNSWFDAWAECRFENKFAESKQTRIGISHTQDLLHCLKSIVKKTYFPTQLGWASK